MKRFFLFIVLFFAFWAEAQIVEISRIEEVKNYLAPNSVVIFDIDNTLIEPAQVLGSTQWFLHYIEENIKNGMAREEAIKQARSDLFIFQHLTKIKLVEKNTAAFLKDLQKRGVCMMAVTGRNADLVFRTKEQLNSLGIDFLISAPFKGCRVFVYKDDPIIYKSGILYANGNHKGFIIRNFLKKIHFSPKKIIMIDDERSNLLNVEKEFETDPLCFLGLRYGFLDEKIQAFDPEIAQIQKKRISKILSDEKAKKILQRKKRNSS